MEERAGPGRAGGAMVAAAAGEERKERERMKQTGLGLRDGVGGPRVDSEKSEGLFANQVVTRVSTNSLVGGE